MKLWSIVSVLFLVISVRCEEKYTSKYDNIDYKAILSSERLLQNYFKCLMDEGPCTPDGQDLKKVIPDILKTDCSKCTEKQKVAGKEIIQFLVNNKLDIWKKMMGKYDPEDIYKERYQEEWKKEGMPLYK